MSRWLFDALHELGERIAAAPRLLVCLDLDGTITPIAEHPDDVVLSPVMVKSLQTLGSRDNVTLAVISGRDRADVQKLIGLPGAYYAGNHGLEISGPGQLFIEPTAASCQDCLRRVSAELKERVKNIDGVFVEEKGLTSSVHYRQAAPERAEEIRQIVHSVLAKADHPFVLTTGAKVYEIRPRVNWNKGSAVDWIRKQLGENPPLVIYAGDDASDEDAFVELKAEITIKVGEPADTAAHFFVASSGDVGTFLAWLVLVPQNMAGTSPDCVLCASAGGVV
jgi:trehalose 6-phosphate phosphatase